MKRLPCVAGYFYPGKKDDLLRTLERLISAELKKEKAIAVVSPHAGYEYSGFVAGATFSSVSIPDNVIILGPSHRAVQSKFAIMTEGTWETPLGVVPIEENLAKLLLKNCSLLSDDPDAHINEHSLEVQLPFLQFIKPNISIVPLIIAYNASFGDLEELGKAIAKSINGFKKEVLIVASTDMSHYVDSITAKEKDFLAIKKIEKLDARGLYDIIQEKDISMCGFQPTTVAIVAAKELGAKKGELKMYQTSGDVTRDYTEVVGYAGMLIK